MYSNKVNGGNRYTYCVISIQLAIPNAVQSNLRFPNVSDLQAEDWTSQAFADTSITGFNMASKASELTPLRWLCR